MTKPITLLALCGSLRQQSYNMAALEALQHICANSQNAIITIAALGDIPLFNPDREDEAIGTVVKLKAALAQADGLIIASPEYAHGISGVLKNTLDWLVSGDEFPYKPIMLVNTSPRAHHALDALKEVLTTMSGTLISDAEVTLPLLGTYMTKAELLADTRLAESLNTALTTFITHIGVQAN